MAEETGALYKHYLAGEGIKDFFQEYEHVTNNIEWDVFILVSRKGYWDYKIFFPDGFCRQRDRVVVSDRFVDKCPVELLENMLSGKTVIIIDDSLNNGHNMFHYFQLCKKCGAKRIYPTVYAMNYNFLLDNESAEGFEEFKDNLWYKIILGACDIDRLSIWQTELFQRQVSPLVMDLPVLNHIQGIKAHKITIDSGLFEDICACHSGGWQFVKNSMKGWGTEIQCSYFRLLDQAGAPLSGSCIHDLIVKCKYQKREDDKVDVVFTPFAIVKSSSFEDVFATFVVLYQGTKYGKMILERFPHQNYSPEILRRDPNLARAMFRANVFSFSLYIGQLFRAYLQDQFGLSAAYDREMMFDNFNAEFIDTQDELLQDYDRERMLQKFSSCTWKMQAAPINKRQNVNKTKVNASQKRIELYFRGRICQIKQDCAYSDEKNKIYTFETIEQEIKERFLFEDEKTYRQLLTNVILLFLETSSFSNMIYADVEDHVLYRGFRYGENTDVFLGDNLWFFYAFLNAYYERSRREEVRANYFRYMEWLESYFEKENMFDVWISSDEFYFLRDYYGCKDNEHLIEEIKRRRYLLDYEGYGEEASQRRTIIYRASEAAGQWTGA